MLYMLDTDTSSYIIRGGYGPIERKLLKTPLSELCISAATRAELQYGLLALPPQHRLHGLVTQFLSTVIMLSWDAVAADTHAQIRYQLKKSGTPIGYMDVFIAAHAIAEHATLVTNNTRHYKQIKLPLLMENWMA